MTDIQNERLGYKVNGQPVYPAKTLGGRDYDHTHNRPAVTGLSHDYFVVLDDFPAPGFDTAGEIQKLADLITEAHKAPAKAPPRADKDGEGDK